MIRETFAKKYNEEVRMVIQDLLKSCYQKQVHIGDILVCQQNGFMMEGVPCLGLGETGINYYKQINQVVYDGIGEITKDNDCFFKSRNTCFNGTTNFEHSIADEMHKYQMIWENGYFLRLLKELSLLINGKHYDWDLDIDAKTKNTRSNYIKDSIIAKFVSHPNFYNLLIKVYNRDLRNAISHTQYNLIQGGFVLTNIQEDENPFGGLTFEEWEEIYCKSWFLLNYIFSGLKDYMELCYVPLSKLHPRASFPIIIPKGRKEWIQSSVFYNLEGNRWTFIK